MFDPIITVTDCRRHGFCAIGIRRWFEQNGLDFRKFVRQGIPYSQISTMDDAYLNRIMEAKASEAKK